MLAVSMEVEVFFNGVSALTAEAWQAEITRLGFSVELDPGTNLESLSGFQPVTIDGERSGFECYRRAVAASPPRTWWRRRSSAGSGQTATPAGIEGDESVAFRWGGDLVEMAAALSAAAALAVVTNGTLWDPQESRSYTPEEAVELARTAL